MWSLPGCRTRASRSRRPCRPGSGAASGQELVTAIELPLVDGPVGATHVRRTRRRGHDLASVTLACAVRPRGPRHPWPTGVSGHAPWLVTDESGHAADLDSSAGVRLAVLDGLFSAAAPSSTSMRASPEYRLAMLRVLGLRAIETAHRRLAEFAA